MVGYLFGKEVESFGFCFIRLGDIVVVFGFNFLVVLEFEINFLGVDCIEFCFVLLNIIRLFGFNVLKFDWEYNEEKCFKVIREVLVVDYFLCLLFVRYCFCIVVEFFFEFCFLDDFFVLCDLFLLYGFYGVFFFVDE